MVGTVVSIVQHSVIVNVVVTGISELITIHVLLQLVPHVRAVVARVAHAVMVRVSLVSILHQRTIVETVLEAIVISVGVAGVPHAVPVTVLLDQSEMRTVVT